MKKYRKLKGRLAESDIDQKYICQTLGRSQTYISRRMTGKMPWTMDDVYGMCDLLQIPPDEIPVYFPRGGQDALTGKAHRSENPAA